MAVKAFSLDLTPEQAERLASEFRELVALDLRHPCVPAPIAAGVEESVPYLAVPYVAGESLDAAIRQYGPAPAGDAIRLITHVADALDAAADAGVFHGSLHPRDVLVTPGETHVTGLGVAQALERTGLHGPIRRPYVAPEREGGEEWGASADVYALGAIAYEVLTGRRALPGTDQPLPALADLRAHQPVALREAIEAAMDPDPERRPARAREFAEAFARALSEVGEPGLPPARPAGARPRKARSRPPKLPGLDEPLVPAGAAAPVSDVPVPASRKASPGGSARRQASVVPPVPAIPVPEASSLEKGHEAAGAPVVRTRGGATPARELTYEFASDVPERPGPDATAAGEAPAAPDVVDVPATSEGTGAFQAPGIVEGPSTLEEGGAPAAPDVAEVSATLADAEAPGGLEAVGAPAPPDSPAEAGPVPQSDQRPVPEAETPAGPPLPSVDEAVPVPAALAAIDVPALTSPFRDDIDLKLPGPAAEPESRSASATEPGEGAFALDLEELDRGAGVTPARPFAADLASLDFSLTPRETAVEETPGTGDAIPAAPEGAGDRLPARPFGRRRIPVRLPVDPPAAPAGSSLPGEPSRDLFEPAAGRSVEFEDTGAGAVAPMAWTPASRLPVVAGIAAGLVLGLVLGYWMGSRQPAASPDPGTSTREPAQVAPAPAPVEPPAELRRLPPAPAPETRESVTPPPPVPAEKRVTPPAAAPKTAVAPARGREEATSAPASGQQSLVIQTRPAGARVRVGGRDVGVTPVTVSPIRPGLHKIELRLDGYRPWAETLTVKAGQVRRVAVSLERASQR